MIAVTFALPTESSAFTRLLQNPVRGSAGERTISGTLHGRAVCVLHTGVGKRSTQEHLTNFLAAQKPELLISAGFAGALDDQLQVGEVFVAENFSHEELARRCEITRARLATVADVIESAADRAELARQTGAAAIDMETEWIAERCRAAGIPFLAVRVISDSAAAPLPAPARVLFDVDRQRTPLFRLTLHLLRHPLRLIDLIGFANRIETARRNLADALAKFCAQ